MSADRIDHRGLLADEQVTGTVQRQAALLLWHLGCDEPHVRPSDCFTDRLGVSGIVLVPLHIGLHEAGGIRRTVWPSACSSRDQ